MGGLGFLIPTLILIAASAFIVKAGAVALRMTGLDAKRAKFQALSAFAGTGFTTKDSELVVRDDRRRRLPFLVGLFAFHPFPSLMMIGRYWHPYGKTQPVFNGRHPERNSQHYTARRFTDSSCSVNGRSPFEVRWQFFYGWLCSCYQATCTGRPRECPKGRSYLRDCRNETKRHCATRRKEAVCRHQTA